MCREQRVMLEQQSDAALARTGSSGGVDLDIRPNMARIGRRLLRLVSSPATTRSSVVLLDPDGPSSADEAHGRRW